MMISDSTTRALNAINDLYDLLKLAQGAADRVEREVHGPVFDRAVDVSRLIREVRATAEELRRHVEQFVKEQAAASLERS
jgi:predicted nucleotidyltransferase component of viral defense system